VSIDDPFDSPDWRCSGTNIAIIISPGMNEPFYLVMWQMFER
jgi:hypothetical protein